MNPVPRVAVVVPHLAGGGGVTTMARFIYRILSESGRFRPDYISLATSARDTASVRILSPRTWLHGPQIADVFDNDGLYKHVGCNLAELEIQRYQPRRILTELLRSYDLIQVVAGGPAAAWVTVRSGRPVCLFVATTTANERPSLLARTTGWRRLWLKNMTRLTAGVERRVLPLMSHVFAESVYTRSLVSPYVAAERLSIGVPGVDTTQFSPKGFCTNGGILAVGRWSDPRKNVQLLFRAYHFVRHAMPTAPRLRLVGQTGPTSTDWALARALGIEDSIDFLPSVPSERLPEIYRQAALFVLSSDEEGLGIVILEAMASGLPVVSTRCGGTESAVVDGETGLLTPVGHAEELGAAMLTVLTTPGLAQRLGEAGRIRVERTFSLDSAGRVYLDKYREVLNLGSK